MEQQSHAYFQPSAFSFDGSVVEYSFNTTHRRSRLFYYFITMLCGAVLSGVFAFNDFGIDFRVPIGIFSVVIGFVYFLDSHMRVEDQVRKVHLDSTGISVSEPSQKPRPWNSFVGFYYVKPVKSSTNVFLNMFKQQDGVSSREYLHFFGKPQNTPQVAVYTLPILPQYRDNTIAFIQQHIPAFLTMPPATSGKNVLWMFFLISILVGTLMLTLWLFFR